MTESREHPHLKVRCRRRSHLLATVVHNEDGWWLDMPRWGAMYENNWKGTPSRRRISPPGAYEHVGAASRMGCACGTGTLQPHQEILDAIIRGDTVLFAY